MDDDVARMYRQAAEKQAQDLKDGKTGTLDTEWEGTGLCPEAQADGVPCHQAGRACDICGRARTWESGEGRGSKPSSGRP